MKNTFLVFIAILFINQGCAQTTTLKWYEDMSEASAASVKENKPMLLFFTGSDWCGWCIRLQKEVFKTSAFESWASENVILVDVDFPKNKVQPQNIKEQNNALQQQFGIQGYPTVWFVKLQEEKGEYKLEPLDKTGYLAGGPDNWIGVAKSIITKGE